MSSIVEQGILMFALITDIERFLTQRYSLYSVHMAQNF